jgi:hypothetical protein
MVLGMGGEPYGEEPLYSFANKAGGLVFLPGHGPLVRPYLTSITLLSRSWMRPRYFSNIFSWELGDTT